MKTCISCGLCERNCPTDAIKLKQVRGFEKKKSVCDHKTCIRCGECAFVCPVKAISFETRQEVLDAGQ